MKVAILAPIFFPFEGRRFLVRKELSFSQGSGPFERGNRPVIPDALQIRPAVSRARRLVGFRRAPGLRGRCCSLAGQGHGSQCEDRESDQRAD